MKSSIKISLVFSIILFSLNSYGQKWKSDPTYSVNNYKHPNKAAAAKEADHERLKDIQYVHALVPMNNNYKAQNLVVMREPKKVQVISQPEKNIAPARNYKQQFAPSKRTGR